METGKLIKELRIKKGMTQEELADKTEVSARTIQRIENGEVDPRAYTLQMIAKALDVDFKIFIENGSREDMEIKKVNDNNWLGLLYLSGIIPIIFPTILIWNTKKYKVKGITSHYRVVMSFQLVIIGVLLGSLWVYYNVNILTPFVGVLIVNGLFSLMNTLRILIGSPAVQLPFLKKRDKTNHKQT